MADINLLQNQIKDTTLVSSQRTKIVVWLALVVLVILGAGCVGLYFLTNQVTSKTADLTNTNSQLQAQLDAQKPSLGSAEAYQAQLSNIKSLLQGHLEFTSLIDEVSKYTYQKAYYTIFDVDQGSGKVHVEGIVDSYTGLGKLLLGLSTSSHFKNVKLLSINQATGEATGYLFSIDMNATPDSFTK